MNNLYRWATPDGVLHASTADMTVGEAICGWPPPPYKMTDDAGPTLLVAHPLGTDPAHTARCTTCLPTEA